MMGVAVTTILLYTLAASALALSFGALYPQFGTENAAQIPTSFGGLVYMMSSLSLLALIIMIEAGPVTTYLRDQRYAEQPVGVTFQLVSAGVAVVAVCAAATIVPLRLGLRRIEMMEW
jgi:ABC-2 type transport system permease protein